MALKFLNDGYFAGKVGIGTESPIELLHLYGGVGNPTRIRLQADDGQDDVLTFHQSTTQKGAVGYDDSDDVVSLTYGGLSGTTGIKINSSGNVGIGTASPNDILQVNQGSAAFRGITIEGTSPALYLKDTQATNAYHIGSNGNYLYFLEDSNQSGGYNNIMAFWDPSNNFIFSLGNVGIGTSAPSQKLHVAGNARVTGAYYDSNNSPGTANQVLVSTASGTDWVDGSGSSIIGGPYLPLAGGTMTGVAGVIFPDNFNLKIGTGSDLQIYHDGTHSHIINTTGDLTIDSQGDDLLLKAADDLLLYVQSTEVALQAIGNAGVKIRYNNVVKFETTSTGVNVTGQITTTGTSPSILFNETDVTANWRNRVSSGSYRVQYASDGSTFSDYFVLGASANTVEKDTTFVGKVITTEVESASALLLDATADITLDTGGGNINLKDDGTQFGRFTKSGDNFHITATRQDGDIKFFGSDGGSSITAFRLDMSDSGWAYFNAGINLGTISNATSDTDKFLVSDGGDIEYRTGAQVLSDIGAAPAGPGGVGYLPLSAGSSYPLTDRLYVQDDIYMAGSHVIKNISNNLFLDSASGYNVIIRPEGNERMRITSAGNVGIGTTSPNAKLDVAGTGNFTGLVSGITPVAAANFVTKAYVDGSGGGTGPFLPLAGGTLTGTLISTQNNGAPSIYINSSRPTLGFTDTNSFPDPNDIYLIRATSGAKLSFNFYDDSASTTTETFNIDPSGNATFAGDINLVAGKKLQYSANSFMTPENNVSGAEISTAGTFIVKTGTTPTLGLTLDASQNATFAGDVTVSTSAFSQLDIITSRSGATDNIGGVQFYKSSTLKGQIFGVNDGKVKIATNGNTVALTLDESQNATFAGDITLGANHIGRDDDNYIGFETDNLIKFRAAGATQVKIGDGIFSPQTDSYVDLGSSGVRFKELWVDSINGGSVVPGSYLPLAGGTMTGAIVMDNNDISGVRDLGVNNELAVGIDVASKTFNYGSEFTANGASIQFVYGRTGSATGKGAIGADQDSIFSVWNVDSGASEKFRMAKDGAANFTNSLYIPDYIYHTGDVDTYFGFPINDNFKVTIGGNDNITANINAVSLKYAGALKLITTSSGVTVTGSLVVSNDITATGDLSVRDIAARDLTLSGKGTSLATAASDGSTTLTTKSYVDGLVTGVPVYKGTWAAGTTGVTSAAISSTTITLTAAPTETIAIGDVVTADGITAAITVTAVGSQTSVTVNASVTIASGVTVTFSPEGGYPDLTLAAAKVLGNYYIVSTAGSAAPNGSGVEPDSWAVGDWCIFSDVTPGAGTDLWQRIDNSSVISGAGTGGTIPLWEGATNAVSETLTDSPITVSGNNTTFAGNIVLADGGGVKSIIGPTSQSLIINSRPNGTNEGLFLQINGNNKLSILKDGNATFAGSINGGDINLSSTNNAIIDPLSVGNILRFTDNDPTQNNNQITGTIEWETKDSNNPGIQSFITTNSTNQGEGRLVFGTGLGGSAVERMRIDSDGNVGIGVTEPDNKLMVQGASTNGAASAGNVALFEGPSGTNGLKVFVDDTENAAGFQTISADDLLINPHGGNVGIGTVNPSNPLEISSDTSTSLVYQRTGVSANKWGFHSDNDATYWQNVTSSSLLFTLQNGGNVGIGTTGPQSKLQVAGGIQMADDTATASATKVGTMRYRTGTEYVEVTGTELITNGDFTTDTGWTKGAGWTIANGVASLTAQGASSGLGSTVMTVTSGNIYKVVIDVISTSTGFRLYDTLGVIAYGLSVGKNTFYRTVTSSSYQVTPLGLSGASGSIESVSVVEVTAEDASYADMCMQTGSSTYEWVNIVRNTY